jgi:hypothetical protein
MVGGWVFGRWGISPAKSSGDLRQAAGSSSFPAQKRIVSAAAGPPKALMGRPPGINQKGPIPGFVKKEKAPSRVRPEEVDHDALREVLMEGGMVG